MKGINEVFGVNNESISSYLWRKEVDGKLKDSLNENRHIVLYGSSKQGKSSSIRENIKREEFEQINCDINSSACDIYKSLLRKIGVNFKVSNEEAISRNMTASISAKVKTIVAFFGSALVEKLQQEMKNQQNMKVLSIILILLMIYVKS